MEKQKDCIKTYKQVCVNTAHPGKIIVMLYDEALKQIDVAIQKIGEGLKSMGAANSAILKAHDIVTELSVSLDMQKGGEIAKQLHNLYDFFARELIRANMKKDSNILLKIRTLIADLRESWQKIAHTTPPQNETQPSAVDIHG